MKDIFFSELRRFRTAALVAATAHLLLLLLLNRTSDLLQQSYYESAPMFGAYLLLGLALAIVQVGSYRKPSQWLWLMHRPLPPERIFMALALSALALLAFAVFIPMLLFVVATDAFTTRVVDVRHYVMVLHVLAFTMMAWSAGAHACVSRHKAAVAVLAAPVLLALHLVSVWWLLLPVAFCLAWLMYIAMRSFRANRDAPVKGSVALVMTALPLQLGFFVLIFFIGKMLFTTGSIMLGTDPLNTEFPPEGGLIEIERSTPADALVLGLAGSSDARAESWREQLALMEPIGLRVNIQRFPIRHQFGNLAWESSQWFDEERVIEWTFSHDRMLYHGRDPKSGADRGWWGVRGAGDETPFTSIPIASDNAFLLTQDALYAIDHDAARQHELLHLAPGELFIGAPRAEFNRMLVLTNHRLLAYRADRAAASDFAPPILDWELPLPRGAAHLETVHIAELMDGWLASFVYGAGHRQIGFNQFNVVTQPWQQVVHVDEDGNAAVMNARAIRRDYPALYETSWWFSPALHVLAEWPDSALDKGLAWPLELELLPKVPVFYPVAAVLMLLSLALGAWWLRGAKVSPARRRVWLASCALLGLPAFLSLMCLEPRA